MGSVRHISDEEIAYVLTTDGFVASCDEAFRLYGHGDMVNPVREESVQREGDMDFFRLELPGEWTGKFRGRKVIEERSDVETGRLGKRTAMIELEDVQTGECAVLDAEHVTNMRTGAAGALGAKYLAQMPVRTAAILGTGRIAKALAQCIDAVLKPEVIRVTSRTVERREAFVADMQAEIQSNLCAADDIASCLSGADAAFVCVPTPLPIVHDLDTTVHISVMGGDARTTQLDPTLLCERFVVPDHSEQVLNSGEFIALAHMGKTPQWVKGQNGRILTVGDAALGCVEKLRGKGVIVYFSGMAIQDVHAAATAWQKLR